MTSIQWQDFIEEEKKKPYFKSLLAFLKKEKLAGKIIYPAREDIFNALKYTAFADTKVVILGQDPYHNPNQAHGLSFSVKETVRLPPSLQNIFKELQSDVGHRPESGCLVPWAQQGVLLLNTTLTVEQNKPNSHRDIGWTTFTDRIIEVLNQHHEPIVYLLWGAHAQQKESLIDKSKHFVLKSPHPSPFSAHRGFLGCRHFSKANKILIENGRSKVNW